MFANSRYVATFFEKRHDNVLRDLEERQKSLSPQIRGQWYWPTRRATEVGFGVRQDLGSTEDVRMARLRLDPIWQELQETQKMIAEWGGGIQTTANYILQVCIAILAFEIGKYFW